MATGVVVFGRVDMDRPGKDFLGTFATIERATAALSSMNLNEYKGPKGTVSATHYVDGKIRDAYEFVDGRLKPLRAFM